MRDVTNKKHTYQLKLSGLPPWASLTQCREGLHKISSSLNAVVCVCACVCVRVCVCKDEWGEGCE